VKVRIGGEVLETTPGRVLFNDRIPKELRFINKVINRKSLGQLVAKCYRKLGAAECTRMLDSVKAVGFAFATRAGTTIGLVDLDIPSKKATIIAEAEKACRPGYGTIPPWLDYG
jgi:DNA-directed RNA polymerase subunit beta'